MIDHNTKGSQTAVGRFEPGGSYPSLGEGVIIDPRAVQEELDAIRTGEVGSLIQQAVADTPIVGLSIGEILTHPKIRLSRCTRKQLLRELAKQIRAQQPRKLRKHWKQKRQTRLRKRLRYYSRHRETEKAAFREYKKTPRGRYSLLKSEAKRRGLVFELTYPEFQKMVEGVNSEYEVRRKDTSIGYIYSNIYIHVL